MSHTGIRFNDPNLGLLHSKVAYTLATRQFNLKRKGLGIYGGKNIVAVLHTCVSIMLKCTRMQKLIKIYRHAVQEL